MGRDATKLCVCVCVWSDDWLAYGGARYLFVTDADRRHDLNHDDASRACRRLNSQLVSVSVSRMSTLTDTRFGQPACE